MVSILKPNKLCCCFLLLLLTGASLYAQTITGKVIDSGSGRPISNASVYLNASSTGTMTDAAGEFTLRVKTANIPLVVSCIGYESETITKYGSQALVVRLTPKAMILKEVTIGGMPREKMLAMFLKEFLGISADGCTITNTDDLTLSYSKKANRLTAEADKPLQIVNKKTGYKITYFLKNFMYTDTLIRLRGNYFFTEDTAGLAAAEIRKILKTRESYYLGSKMHFIRSLWRDSLKKNKFELYTGRYDGSQIIPTKAVISTYQNQKYITYKNAVYIVYRDNFRNASSLTLPPGRDAAFIDSDGYYDADLYWWGEMTQQRIAWLLPFEYGLSPETQAVMVKETTVSRPLFDSLLNLYGTKHHSPVLFMHFDKNVYSNNENVWFTGYILDNPDSSRYKTLSLALVKNDDRSVLMDDRFVMANGFCFGNTVVPDSVRAGAYTFVAYGNRLENNLPDIIFTQQVTIKTADQQTFNASLNPLDTAATAVSQKVMLLVNVVSDKAPASVPVTYYVGDARKPVTAGAVKTAAGQYIFNIPSNLLSAGNNKLHVQIKYKTEVQDISMELPIPPQPAQVHFYPEGGNLLNGIVNTVGWEAKTAHGAPLYTQAVLYEDNQVVDTISTNGNGMGRFLIVPKKDKKYRVRLNSGKVIRDYDLPGTVNGAALSVKRAIVNDTLLVEVYNDDPKRKLYLVGHNYQQSFFETPITKGPGQRVKIILTNMPRGILQLTLVDSLGRPFAERMVFAHYTNKSKLEISTDNSAYSNRKKVKLNIKLAGEATNAAVSVAVVQENRLEIKNKNDIESYIYLKSNLTRLPVKENYFSNEDFDKRDLENVLLIRGWSRYKWTDMLKVKQEDTVLNSKELLLTGQVTKYTGKFKEPVALVTFNPTNTYQTDIHGGFMLPDSNLIVEHGKKTAVMVANASPADYKIQLINPYDSVNKQLAALMDPVIYHSPAEENSAYLKVPGTERAIQLKEVVIKDKKDDSFYSSFGAPGSNACGDYVCMYNILNCPNHHSSSNNTQPVQGRSYSYQGRSFVYPGCISQPERPNAVSFKGIYAAQEFYPSDYSEINPSQPEYLSTLYWKHQLMLKKGETQEISFYTSDITGPFKVIVQGATNTDVIYGETLFRVNK